MRTLTPTTSMLLYWENLAYSVAALEAMPATAMLAGPIKAHMEVQAPLAAKDKETRLERALNNAKVALYVGDATEAITDLHSELKLALRDRQHPLFVHCYREGLKGLTRLALERQVEALRLLCERMAASGFPEALKEKYQPRLLALAAAGDALVKARQAVEQKRETLRLETTRWRDEANRLRLQTFGDLTRLGSTLHKDRTFAERFFPATTGRRPKDADPEA